MKLDILMSASFHFHRLADINIRSTINSCMTVKEIINELERTLAANLSSPQLLDIPRGTVDSAYVDRIHLLVSVAFSSGCGS